MAEEAGVKLPAEPAGVKEGRSYDLLDDSMPPVVVVQTTSDENAPPIDPPPDPRR
jgi:hypothetical protein